MLFVDRIGLSYNLGTELVFLCLFVKSLIVIGAVEFAFFD